MGDGQDRGWLRSDAEAPTRERLGDKPSCGSSILTHLTHLSLGRASRVIVIVIVIVAGHTEIGFRMRSGQTTGSDGYCALPVSAK